jgi:hypothetical protein
MESASSARDSRTLGPKNIRAPEGSASQHQNLSLRQAHSISLGGAGYSRIVGTTSNTLETAVLLDALDQLATSIPDYGWYIYAPAAEPRALFEILEQRQY